MTLHALEPLLAFFERAGPAAVAIALVSLWLWTRIGEGYALLLFTHRRDAALAREGDAGAAQRLVDVFGQRVVELQGLVAVLPLLGLLGTVGGMIVAFDALSLFGSTNPRALSLGISRAMLTTLAGLVTSLAGLFASMPLERRVAAATRVAASGEHGRDVRAVSPLLGLRSRLRMRSERGGQAE